MEKIKFHTFYSETAIVLIALQLLFIFKPLNWIVNLSLFLLNIFLYGLSKAELTDGKKKFGFGVFNVNFVLLGIGMCTLGIYSLEVMTNRPMGMLKVLLSIVVLLGYIAWATSEKGKELLKGVYENDIAFGKTKNDEIKQGDVKLGIDMNTGNDVILKHKDRFVHLLALGATGTGKTSQILLPMIYQDMQNDNCGITVLEPKSDLAEKVYMMAKKMGKEVQYFNPTLKDCPYFNPLYGPEEIIIENLATTFGMFDQDSSSFFRDMADTLIRNGLRVVKRLKGNDATLLDFSTVIFNANDEGKAMVQQFKRLPVTTTEMAKENSDVASWFLNEYYNEKSKTYEHCSGLRTKVNKLVSNKYLRVVLNPPVDNPELIKKRGIIDFEKHLESNGVLAMATEQGVLGMLGDFIGFFLILSFQSAVLKRPGTEDTRRSNFFYVDEVQVFANPGFSNLLTQGRSYRVACTLATQALDQLGMNSGKNGDAFIQLVTTNARNIVLFPGCNGKDAKYYSDQFGDKEEMQKSVSTSRRKQSILNIGMGYAPPTETVGERTQKVAMYSPSDLIFREFGEVTVRIIKDNTVQLPQVAKISYIPYELNKELDAQIIEFKETQKIHAGREEILQPFDSGTQLNIGGPGTSEPVGSKNVSPVSKEFAVVNSYQARGDELEDDTGVPDELGDAFEEEFF